MTKNLQILLSQNALLNCFIYRTTNSGEADITIDTDQLVDAMGLVMVRLSSNGEWLTTTEALNADWYSTVVFINNDATKINNYIANKSDNDKKSLIAHEIGHTLKIRHPNEFGSGNNYTTGAFICSVMNQGLYSNNTSKLSVVPTQHDIRALKLKWD